MPETATISTDREGATRADRRLLIGGRLVETDRTFRLAQPRDRRGARVRARRAPSPTPRPRSPRRAGRSTPPIGPPNVELRIRCLEQFHQALARPPRRARRADHRRGRCHRRTEPGRAARSADRDRALLRRSVARLSDDRGPRQHREPRHAAPPLGGEGSRRAWSPRSSPTTIPTSWRWPSWRPRWPPAARWSSRPRRTPR